MLSRRRLPPTHMARIRGIDQRAIRESATPVAFVDRPGVDRQHRCICLGRRPRGTWSSLAQAEPSIAAEPRGAVLALDGATQAVRAVAPGFQQPGGLALLHDATLGDRLFAADTLAGTVRVLDAGDLRTLAETAVGPGPYALAAAAGRQVTSSRRCRAGTR